MKYTRVSCYKRSRVRANDGVIFIHERQREREFFQQKEKENGSEEGYGGRKRT
jgi:hypothetical protein